MRAFTNFPYLIVGAVATTVTVFSSVSPAHAQTIIPDRDWKITSGFLVLETAIGLGDSCDVEGWGTADSTSNTGTVEFIDALPGGFLCNFVSGQAPEGLTADVSVNPAIVTAHNTYVDTSVGTCSGDVTGEWFPDAGATEETGSGTLIFDQAAWGDDCLLSGEISVEWPRQVPQSN